MKTSIIALAIAALAVTSATSARSQTSQPSPPQPSTPSIQGVWVLNHDLTDKPPAPGDARPGDGGRAGGGGRRGGFGGGGGGGGRRGGFGGGGFGGGGGGGGGRGGDPDLNARQQEAMRDVMTPPERLTIVQTDSTIIITSGEGRTTRLSPNDKKIKEENTGIDRKTSWQGDRLVSEVNGIGSGTIVGTYSLDPDRHQLRIMMQLPKRNGQTPAPLARVYDAMVEQ